MRTVSSIASFIPIAGVPVSANLRLLFSPQYIQQHRHNNRLLTHLYGIRSKLRFRLGRILTFHRLRGACDELTIYFSLVSYDFPIDSEITLSKPALKKRTERTILQRHCIHHPNWRRSCPSRFSIAFKAQCTQQYGGNNSLLINLYSIHSQRHFGLGRIQYYPRLFTYCNVNIRKHLDSPKHKMVAFWRW